MKRWFACMLAVLVAFSFASARADEIAEGARLAAYGKTLVVTLEENGSTGYVWALNGLEEQTVLALESDTTKDTEKEAVAGSPVERLFCFCLANAGTAALTFTYARPWENEPPLRTLALTVQWEQDGSFSFSMSGFSVK